jgi:acetyl esterase/lipase
MGRDPEYLRFIRNVAGALAAAGTPGTDAEREGFKCTMARAPRPPTASTRDLAVPGGDGPLRARLLVPAGASDVALVYVHGGGWLLGSA